MFARLCLRIRYLARAFRGRPCGCRTPGLFGAWVHLHLYRRPQGLTRIQFGDLILDAHDPKTAQFLLAEIFLDETYGPKLPIENPFIIDCGANCGFATAFFKTVYPGSHIIAIEPSPTSVALLRQNVETNKWRQVEVIEAACGVTAGTMDLIESHYSPLFNSSDPKRSSGRTVSVSVIRLSDLLKDHQHVDLLKMDIEGGEHEILRDLHETGSLQKVRHMVVEYHHRMGESTCRLGTFLSVLESCGFTYSIVAAVNPECRYQKTFQDIMIYARQQACE